MEAEEEEEIETIIETKEISEAVAVAVAEATVMTEEEEVVADTRKTTASPQVTESLIEAN